MNKNQKALFYAKRDIAQIVTDVVNLEDINYTVPEVQTLLDGITVGGHKIQDELITINQIKAWKFLFESIENNEFSIAKSYFLKLHNLVANQEALIWGKFRTGNVSISGTKYMPPSPNALCESYNNLILKTKQTLKSGKVFEASINFFATCARTQFFFDGNKRTGRMMMAGILLSHGLPMINVPALQKLEFNKTMLNYYETENLEPIFKLLLSCIPEWICEEFQFR